MQGQFQGYGRPPAFPPPPMQSQTEKARFEAKQAARKDVKKVVLLLLGLLIGANLLSLLAALIAGVSQAFSTIFGGGELDMDIFADMADSMLMTFITGYLPIMLAEIIVILIGVKVLKLSFGKMFGKSRMGAGFTALGAFGCIGIGVVGQLLTSVMLIVMQLVGFPIYSPDFSLDWGQPLGCALTLGYICLLGPILEELVFRGVILKALQRHGVPFAVLFSAFLFALFHQNLVQLFVPTLLGIFLALLAVRSGSLIPSILAHIANNTVAMLLDMVLPADNPALYWIGYLIYAVVFIGIAAIFMILYLKELTPLLKWKHPVLKLSAQLGNALSHWPTVVFMVLYGLMIVYTTLIALLQGM